MFTQLMSGHTNHSMQRDSWMLRNYGSIILGLEERMHAVVINNKTLIFLWLGTWVCER